MMKFFFFWRRFLSSFPDLLFQHDCRGLHSFRWARLSHTSARKVLIAINIIRHYFFLLLSNETFDNINILVISFLKHQSQRYNDELSSVRGRVPLPARNENEPPQQVHHLVMTIRLGRSFADNVRFHLINRSLDIRDTAWCDCGTWRARKRDKGLIIFLQQLSSDLASEGIDSGNRNRPRQKKKRILLPSLWFNCLTK